MTRYELMREIIRLDSEYLLYKIKGDLIRAQQARDLADVFSKQLKNTHEVNHG